MGVNSTGINLELAHLGTAHLGLRQHALNRLAHHPVRMIAFQDGTSRAALDAAGIAGVVIVNLIGLFIAVR